jgi:DNA/RNA endonuclease YhcR with UshA esterase domain
MAMGENRGWFGRKLYRLTCDESVLEAEELQDQVEEVGATPVMACTARRNVCVTGTVKSVTLKSLAGAPSLEAEIYDGTGSVTAIFLGRRRICGIETGKSMVLRGRITEREGQSIIYNPRYELLAAAPAA